MGIPDHPAPVTRTYAPGRPLVFNHIPKTAGTSLRDALVECLEPEVMFVGLDSYAFGSLADLDSIDPRARAQVAASPDELPPDASFVSGHITPATTMARYPESDHLTVLREPQARLVSLWLFNRAHTNFMLRHWGGLMDSLRACRVPLVDYLNNPLVAAYMDNAVTRFLVWPHPLAPDKDFIDASADDELFAAALERLDRYAFVGLVEDRDLVGKLGAWLGRDLVTYRRTSEHLPLPRGLRPDVEREVSAAKDVLRIRSRIDMRVWNHLVRTMMPETEPAALSARTLQDTVRRHQTAVAQAPPMGFLMSAVEHAYNISAYVRARRSGE